MSTTQVLGGAPYASPGQPHASLTGRIDALPASFGLWSFITLLSLGGFFELYDLFQTGYISAGLLADGIFHTGQAGIFGIADQAAFASATFMGLFIGASLLAPLADRLGRRLTFMVALAWYGLFSLLMATQSSAEGVIFFRFLVGIGLGIELVTIDTYLSEWMPTHLRNKAFAFAFFIQFPVGSGGGADVLDAGANHPLRPQRLALGDHLWRAVLAGDLVYPQKAARVSALAGKQRAA